MATILRHPLLRILLKCAVFGLGSILTVSLAATLISYPWSTDPQGTAQPIARSAEYYKRAYAAGSESRMDSDSKTLPISAKEQFYIDYARNAAKSARVVEKLTALVHKYSLENSKTLEVGAGSGLLQDIVPNYTALDISPNARRFFHKPFVEASATDMPFPDNSFDLVWTVWVLEHIPNPEKALLEMRRIVKPGGHLILWPAFDVDRFVGQGYAVRPYSDFDWKGKLMKAMVPIGRSKTFHFLQYHQSRLLRSITSRFGGGPSRFRFKQLDANYENYWETDSDATVSFTAHELYLWHASRGDTCLSCPTEWQLILRDMPRFTPDDEPYLVVRVNK